MLKKSQPEDLKRIIGPLKIDLENDGSLDNLGQPNIIDYVDHEPFLTSMSERGLGGGQPGTILPNNEPTSRSPYPVDGLRPGGEFDKTTGDPAVGSQKSQPTLPTGAPTSIPKLLPTENLESIDECPKKHDFLAEGPPGSSDANECQICGFPKTDHIINQEAFVESEHPRDDDGKFTSNFGSSAEIGESNKTEEKQLTDSLDSSKVSEEFQEKILNPFSRTTDPDSSYGYADIEKTWDKAIKENPELEKIKQQLTDYESSVNNAIKKTFDETTSLWRGMRGDELDHMSETGTVEPYQYNFVSYTMDEKAGMGFGRNASDIDGVTVEFDKDQIKNQKLWNGEDMIIKPVEYSAFYDHAGLSEEIDGSYPISFADEREVRSVQFDVKDTIKSITIHQSQYMDDKETKILHDKYSKNFPDVDISIVKTDSNKESMDYVNQHWQPKPQNPDHGSCCQMHTEYENKGPTLFHQATPDFEQSEFSMGIGKMNPDDTDRNIVLRASQAFSDNQESFTFEECSKPWKEAELPREDSFEMPSVVVGKATYFPEEKSMIIELSGRTYPYYNIEYRQWDAFKGATSKGSAYNQMFKGQTQYFSPRNDSAVNQEALNVAIQYREAMMIDNPDDFHWIDEVAIKEMMLEGQKGRGKYILLKAAEAAITDHRVEGEDHKRIITPEILKKLTYTAIKKGSDINHLYPKRDLHSGLVVDAEFNDRTGFSEFMYFESDMEILQGLENKFITAVSINGGAARSYKIIDGEGKEMENPSVQCADGDCYRLGDGIILGEKDNVAFTWVVTKPGWRYNGRMIPHTEPGVKSTRILVL